MYLAHSIHVHVHLTFFIKNILNLSYSNVNIFSSHSYFICAVLVKEKIKYFPVICFLQYTPYMYIPHPTQDFPHFSINSLSISIHSILHFDLLSNSAQYMDFPPHTCTCTCTLYLASSSPIIIIPYLKLFLSR